MQRIKVESSLIASAGYDDKKNVLEIEFKDASIWNYYKFPVKQWTAFQAADSKGKFFHAIVIKDRKKPAYFGRCVQAAGKKPVERPNSAPGKGGVVGRPIYKALIAAKAALKAGSVFPYCLWVACGREQTSIHAVHLHTFYGQCIQLMHEATGIIGKESLDATIKLAKERGL